MFLLEQQARKRGWTNHDKYACTQCRTRADPQQVLASPMIMYLYLYPGFSVTECIMHSDMMHSDLPMFVLLQAAKQKQQEEEAARKKKAEEEAARKKKAEEDVSLLLNKYHVRVSRKSSRVVILCM